MRRLEELQLVTSDITTILPKVIKTEVEEAARAKRYGRQLLRLNRDLVGKSGRSIWLPVSGTISATRVQENVDITGVIGTQKVSYSGTVEATPFKIGTWVSFSVESLNAAEVDVLNGHIKEAGEAMALLEDAEIMYEVNGKTPIPTAVGAAWTAQTDEFNGDGSTTDFTLSKAFPVLEVTAVTVGGTAKTAITDYKVDFYDHKVRFTTAPGSGTKNVDITYFYSSRTYIQDAITETSAQYADLVAAVTVLRANKRTGNVLVVNPNEAGDFLSDTRFTDVSKYGAAEPILNGEIGKICGLKVLVTTQQYQGVLLLIDTTAAGWLVIKRDVEVRRWETPAKESLELYFFQEFTPKITNDNAISLVVNAQQEALDF